MSSKTGKAENMSFYIGPTPTDGFKAEVKIGKEMTEKSFSKFSDAVKWVEQLQKNERDRIENQRNKEET